MSYDSIRPARLLIRLIKALGLWSYHGEIIRPLYKLFGWSLHTCFTFLFIAAMYVNVAQMETIDDFVNALYMAMTETVLLVKMLNILTISQKLVDFLELMEHNAESQPQNRRELKMLQDRQDTFIKLRNIYIAGVCSVLVISDLGPVIEADYKLPFPCWIPFDYRNRQMFPYAFVYVAIGMIVTACGNMTMDLMQAFLLLQLATYFKLVAMRLQGFGPPGDISSLKRVMRFHNFAERMVLQCQDIISIPVFAQISISAFILCFTVYQLQKMSPTTHTADFIMLLIFAVLMILQIYLPCYYGNEVTISASELTGAIYESNWVELPAESRKLIFVYMEGLKRPVHVRAGQFFGIGIKVFTKTINNAYSLLALLLNIKK